MKFIAIFVVRCYQRFLSPILPRSCRFEPSCSAYAIEAFRKKGFCRGFGLIVWRVLRCHPWSRGGHDPVDKPAKQDASRQERQGTPRSQSEGSL